MTSLATRAQVYKVAYGKSTGIDYSGSDCDTAITDSESEIFSDYGYALRKKVYVQSSRTQYEFRPTRAQTFSIERVFVNSPNININNAINRNLVNSSSYTASLSQNKITISSALASQWHGSYLEVDFYPQEWHLLVKNKAALNILDGDMAQMNPGEGGTDNPRVSRIAKRISRIQGMLQPMIAVGSFENINYDVRNREEIVQERYNKTA